MKSAICRAGRKQMSESEAEDMCIFSGMLGSGWSGSMALVSIVRARSGLSTADAAAVVPNLGASPRVILSVTWNLIRRLLAPAQPLVSRKRMPRHAQDETHGFTSRTPRTRLRRDD